MSQAPAIDADQFLPYLDLPSAPLIPLLRWDAKAGNGKELGKRPRDVAWTQTNYPAADVVKAAVADGTNIGFRPPADMLVIDYDKKRDEDGSQWTEFFKRFPSVVLSVTPMVRTGGGG